MSYQEKRTLTSIVTGAALLVAYLLYAFGKTGPGTTAPDDVKAWATAMLIFVGIGIAATIVIQIVFHILLSVGIAVKEAVKGNVKDGKAIGKAIDGEMVEDERDKLIELKASRISLGAGGMGFIAGLILLACGYSAALMLNVAFITFSAGSVVEGFVQLYYYRRGVKHV